MNKVIVILIVAVVAAGVFLSSNDLSKNTDAAEENSDVENTAQLTNDAPSVEATTTEEESTDSTEEQKEDFSSTAAAAMVEPIIYGDADAPVVIQEYASYSCSHCATFHSDRLPALMEKYINAGKVRLEMNSFVRNNQDLRATMLIQCLDDNKKRRQFAGVLLKSQSKWAYSADFIDNLRTIAGVGGVSADAFDACMERKDLEEAIIQSRKKFDEEVAIPSTPYFIIHGNSIKGVRPIEAYEEAIEAELAKH